MHYKVVPIAHIILCATKNINPFFILSKITIDENLICKPNQAKTSMDLLIQQVLQMIALVAIPQFQSLLEYYMTMRNGFAAYGM